MQKTKKRCCFLFVFFIKKNKNGANNINKKYVFTNHQGDVKNGGIRNVGSSTKTPNTIVYTVGGTKNFRNALGVLLIPKKPEINTNKSTAIIQR